jgi:hypothetical protein
MPRAVAAGRRLLRRRGARAAGGQDARHRVTSGWVLQGGRQGEGDAEAVTCAASYIKLRFLL